MDQVSVVRRGVIRTIPLGVCYCCKHELVRRWLAGLGAYVSLKASRCDVSELTSDFLGMTLLSTVLSRNRHTIFSITAPRPTQLSSFNTLA